MLLFTENMLIAETVQR